MSIGTQDGGEHAIDIERHSTLHGTLHGPKHWAWASFDRVVAFADAVAAAAGATLSAADRVRFLVALDHELTARGERVRRAS